MKTMLRTALLLCSLAAAASAAAQEKLESFTVCADPGNMPLSNEKGEGFQNKIAEVLGKTLGTGVKYVWRPSIERGLMRSTLQAGSCDLWMDMASDTEGAEITTPLYRSTFVLVYREDKGYTIKSFDDPTLQRVRIGVFQVSAIRQALAAHGIMQNTVIQYLSHNGDLVPENQPSYQVQQVIDGKIEMAGVWGPMAGYYKTIKKAPLVIQPVNLMDETVPLEFDMAMAVPRGRPEVKTAIEKAMHDSKDQIRAILVEYGVPLVKCDDCIIDGDLPSHGPYKPAPPPSQSADANGEHRTDVADLKKWLAQGADPTEELGHAIIADDMARVTYLLDHKADPNARTGDGYTALGNAVRFGFTPIATLLVERNADPNITDLSGWTPLMYATWSDQDEMVKLLLAHGAKLDVTKEADGVTPLAIAAQNNKKKTAPLLINAGADVNHAVGKGAYTPLMLASTSGSVDIAQQLVAKGADVNAKNPGGVTALMIAAAGNRTEIVTILIQAGADPNMKSEDGRTALTIAQGNNSDAVVKILQAAQRGGEKSS